MRGAFKIILLALMLTTDAVKHVKGRDILKIMNYGSVATLNWLSAHTQDGRDFSLSSGTGLSSRRPTGANMHRARGIFKMAVHCDS